MPRCNLFGLSRFYLQAFFFPCRGTNTIYASIQYAYCRRRRFNSRLTVAWDRNYNTSIFMVKIHLFSGFENSRLKIERDTRLGHLYSDFSLEELLEAACLVGVKSQCIQNSRGFYHFDLWGKPLLKARLFFPRVNNRELYRDLQAVPGRNHHSFTTSSLELITHN
jgi:hypothetical protein